MKDLKGTDQDRPQLRKRVLVINDDLVQLGESLNGLRVLDLSVIATNSGVEGWELFQAELPGVVVLDLVLADLDGFELLRRMKEHPHAWNCVVIVTHPHPEDQDLFRACQLGKDCFLVEGSMELMQLPYWVKRFFDLVVPRRPDTAAEAPAWVGAPPILLPRNAAIGSVAWKRRMNDLRDVHRGRPQPRELILVVNDNPNWLDAIRSAILFLGIPIITATSGAEGWGLFESERPGMVILDLVLADMDGYGLLRQITTHPRWVNCGVIVTHPQPEVQDVFRACQLGKDCFLAEAVEELSLLPRCAWAIFDSLVPGRPELDL